jgi:putative sterol carrier protein
VAKWLTQEWLDEAREQFAGQPERPGATARVQYVVAGGPDGEVRYYSVIEDGRLLEAQLGELADAEVTLFESYAVGRRIQEGELDPGAAFMQGSVKVTGSLGKLLSVLPITTSPEYRAAQAELSAKTEF